VNPRNQEATVSPPGRSLEGGVCGYGDVHLAERSPQHGETGSNVHLISGYLLLPQPNYRRFNLLSNRTDMSRGINPHTAPLVYGGLAIAALTGSCSGESTGA